MTQKERNAKWMAVHTLEERRAYRQERRRVRRAEYLASSRRANRTVKHRYGVLKNAAKHRNLICTLAFDEYAQLISNPCFYCGGVLSETGGGLDRINNEIGYVTGNVRPCCHVCNQAKSSFTEAQFQEWLLRVYNYYLAKS